MSTRLRDPSQLQACPASLRTLHRYWQGKRRGDALPGRPDIDPVELRAYLGRLAIAELRGGELIYRLVGTELVEEWGQEPTGRRIADTLPGEYAETFMTPYRIAVEEAVPVHARLPMRTRPWRGLSVEALFLPLARDGRSVDMVLAYGTKPRDRAPARLQSMRYPTYPA